jgi:hypothetical protein
MDAVCGSFGLCRMLFWRRLVFPLLIAIAVHSRGETYAQRASAQVMLPRGNAIEAGFVPQKLGAIDKLLTSAPEFDAIRVLSKDAARGQSLTTIATPATTPPTIRHLLTHTSGITYSFWIVRSWPGSIARRAFPTD